jgi:hypothetical protein
MKFDDQISQLVSARDEEIPAALQWSIRRKIHSRLKPRNKPFHRRILLPALAAGLILVLLSALVLINPPASMTPPMSEVRTEFYLPEKNIKVIWIQNNNFTLRRTKP